MNFLDLDLGTNMVCALCGKTFTSQMSYDSHRNNFHSTLKRDEILEKVLKSEYKRTGRPVLNEIKNNIVVPRIVELRGRRRKRLVKRKMLQQLRRERVQKYRQSKP